jgi:transglutaminase-like putative cysteine protease
MTTPQKVLAIGAAGAAAALATLFIARRARAGDVGEPVITGRAGRQLKATFDRTEGGRRVRGYDADDMTIEDKIGLLQDRIQASVKNPSMRKLALQITNQCPSRDEQCEAAAIHDWVKANIRYTGDIAPHRLDDGTVDSVDLFASAQAVVENGGGDCDEHVVLNNALAILNGIPAQIRATSPTRRGKNNYTHVYAVFGLPKARPTKWIASDTTLPGETRFGTEWPYKRKLDAIA